ncbi:MAG TPA: cytochrome D1 domain-containing protein [Bryobacteraceae bacterium]|nr:cytochrome D1 domain-containing protein [Bryobacteraceae bacterium]
MIRKGTLLLVVLLFSAMPFFAASLSSKAVLIVTNKGDHTMGIIDPESGREMATVDEGGVTGHELIASPDGRFAYVPIYGNSGVGKPGTNGTNMVVIDIAARKLSGNVDFGKGVRPHCPLFGPTNGLLYVTTELENSVSIIDPKSLKIVGSVPTGQPESHMLVISHDGKRGYTANVGPGTVSVLDLQARKTIAIIPIAKITQRIAISNDDRWVFTADQTTPRLAVIDTTNPAHKVKQWVELPGTAYGTAATRDGRWLVAAIQKTNQVAAVDLRTMKVAHIIDVPKIPQEVLIRPDNKVAYVSCDVSGQVAEINLADWKVNRLIRAGKSVDGLAWAAPQ